MRRLFVLVSLLAIIMGWGFNASALLTYSGETRDVSVDWGDGAGISEVRAFTGMRLVVDGTDWRSAGYSGFVPPVIIYGRPMVPLLGVLEKCGLTKNAVVTELSGSGRLKILAPDYSLELGVGDKTVRINGAEYPLDWAPALINGTIYVFVRYMEMLTAGTISALYPSYPDNIVLRRSNGYVDIQNIIGIAYEKVQGRKPKIINSRGISVETASALSDYLPLPFREGGDELSQDLYLINQPAQTDNSEGIDHLTGRVMFGFQDDERRLLNLNGVDNVCGIDIIIDKGTGSYRRISYQWEDADGVECQVTWALI